MPEEEDENDKQTYSAAEGWIVMHEPFIGEKKSHARQKPASKKWLFSFSLCATWSGRYLFSANEVSTWTGTTSTPKHMQIASVS